MDALPGFRHWPSGRPGECHHDRKQPAATPRTCPGRSPPHRIPSAAIHAYFLQVRPTDEGLIDLDKTKIGHEISFNNTSTGTSPCAAWTRSPKVSLTWRPRPTARLRL
ncbi:MAG: hypothetical protein R2838_10530 [Caldilineaceae bacterium]